MLDIAAPAPRSKMHTRSISCSAYERSDGMVDVEATLIDQKTVDIYHSNGRVVLAGGAIHEMLLCLTIDDHMTIRDVVAKTLHSPYRECPEVNARYRLLIGIKIGAGFTSKTRELFRTVNGCTHITELLPVIATTAYQAMYGRMAMSAAAAVSAGEKSNLPSPIGGCYALREGGEAFLNRQAKVGG